MTNLFLPCHLSTLTTMYPCSTYPYYTTNPFCYYWNAYWPTIHGYSQVGTTEVGVLNPNNVLGYYNSMLPLIRDNVGVNSKQENLGIINAKIKKLKKQRQRQQPPKQYKIVEDHILAQVPPLPSIIKKQHFERSPKSKRHEYKKPPHHNSLRQGSKNQKNFKMTQTRRRINQPASRNMRKRQWFFFLFLAQFMFSLFIFPILFNHVLLNGVGT